MERVAPREVLIEAGRLSAERRPYAFATVVRVERPASAREGNHALIVSDGTVVGWIGGACSQPTVVQEALRALADGKPRLVTIEGSCASEGLVEVFIEPQLPEPVLAVLGDGPAARTLADLAARIGWRIVRTVDPDAEAIVVATLGTGDVDALREVLATPAGYIGLVASRRRAGATLAELRAEGADDETLARITSPAGLDLGPSTQEEIAVAVLAELVTWRHRARQASPLQEPTTAAAQPRAGHARPLHVDATAADAPPEPDAGAGYIPPLHEDVAGVDAVDPVCGMTVAAATARETAEHDGVIYYFCGGGCRRRFEENPTSYLEVRTK